MTTTVPHQRSAATSVVHPGRRTLVAMAAAILVGYLVMLGGGADLAYDASLSDIRSAYDGGEGASQITAYLGMGFVALLLFFGAALRQALQTAHRTWLADVSFLGFAALGATVASWAITDVALWKAVEYGDESTIRALVTLSDAGFLPLMAAMIAIYLASGLAGLRTGALPRWLAIASIALGVLAPIGPLGFVGAVLLPVWVLAAAICVRLEAAP